MSQSAPESFFNFEDSRGLRLNYMSVAEAAAYLNIAATTLRRLEKTRQFVPAIKTRSRHRRYSMEQLNGFLGDRRKQNLEKTVCYAYKPLASQKAELSAVVEQLTSWCLAHKVPDFEVVMDLGTGLNFKKKGLVRVIGMVMRREVNQVLLAEVDRSLRFGTDQVAEICRQNDVQVTLLQEV